MEHVFTGGVVETSRAIGPGARFRPLEFRIGALCFSGRAYWLVPQRVESPLPTDRPRIAREEAAVAVGLVGNAGGFGNGLATPRTFRQWDDRAAGLPAVSALRRGRQRWICSTRRGLDIRRLVA